MAGSIAPYSPAETESAARWLNYVSSAFAGPDTPAEAVSAAREAIDKLERRGIVSPAVAALLAEIFDVAEPAAPALA